MKRIDELLPHVARGIDPASAEGVEIGMEAGRADHGNASPLGRELEDPTICRPERHAPSLVHLMEPGVLDRAAE